MRTPPPSLRRSGCHTIRSKTGNTVTISECTEFEKDSSAALSLKQKARLMKIIANNPLQGRPVTDFAGLLEVFFEGHKIIYAASSDYKNIYMVMFVTDGGDGPSGPDEGPNRGRAKKVLAWLVQGGVIGIGKRLTEGAMDILWNIWSSFAPQYRGLEDLLCRLRTA